MSQKSEEDYTYGNHTQLSKNYKKKINVTIKTDRHIIINFKPTTKMIPF